jgi:hypothetical protein
MSSGDISALSDVTTTGASAELGSHAKQQSDANIDEEMETNSNNAAVGDDNDAAVGEDADADTPVSASKAKPNKRSDNAARSNFRLSGQSPQRLIKVLTTDGDKVECRDPRKRSELYVFIKENMILIAQVL